MGQPFEAHGKVVKRILRYLKGTLQLSSRDRVMNWQTLLTAKHISRRVMVAYSSAPTVDR